ncbi:MAG: class I SAM-dependent methyltransferase [Planctomycetes bacterium]|nr:class I SAM-dependent methyltransferase [Planctomycetota bacterium]
MPVVYDNWYNYPQYYDLAFHSETKAEADFIEAACRKYCPFRVRKLLEPGCGTGRLVVELAGRGYELAGFDRNDAMLGYLRRRLARRGLEAEVFFADMADFRLHRPVDVVFCTWNTFRHLTTEQAARRHLECVAGSLRPGGIYILGFHLLPLDVSDECVERWSARHGGTKVTVTLRVLATDRRRRIEKLRASLRVRSGSRDLRLRHEFEFRLYTADQFKRLLATVPDLELCDVYDFWYEIDRPLELNDEITDTVFILRKRLRES